MTKEEIFYRTMGCAGFELKTLTKVDENKFTTFYTVAWYSEDKSRYSEEIITEEEYDVLLKELKEEDKK